MRKRHGSVASVYSGFGTDDDDDDDDHNNINNTATAGGTDEMSRPGSRSSQVSTYEGFEGMDTTPNGDSGLSDPTIPSAPASPNDAAPPETPSVWVHGTVYAHKTQFYHGVIDATAAKDTLLKADQKGGHMVGRFLFREAAMAAALQDEPDSHVLSVLTGKDEVTHYRIERKEQDPNAPYTINEQPLGECNTLVDVVAYLSKAGAAPQLSDGVKGLTVISSDDAEAVLQQRERERKTNSPDRMARQQQQQPEQGGNAGMLQANAEVAEFQRGAGSKTPMFLPNSNVTSGDAAGFSVEGCIHPFATSAEANGLLTDADFSGQLLLGKFVLRNPIGKKEQANSCIYIIHVIHRLPSAAQPANLLGCVREARVLAPFGAEGGIFEVDGNEVENCATFQDVMANVLFQWQEGWWETPCTKAVPPLQDRSKSKAIEKAYKANEKAWTKEGKAYEKSMRKKGGQRPMSGISQVSSMSAGSAGYGSAGSPTSLKSLSEAFASSPTSTRSIGFESGIQPASEAAWQEPSIEAFASAEEWFRAEITDDDLAESRLNDKPPGGFMVRNGALGSRQFVLSVRLPKTWAKTCLHLPIAYTPTEHGTTFSLQNSMLVFGSLDAIINHYNKNKAEKDQLPCKLLYAGQEPEKLVVNYKVSASSAQAKKWATSPILPVPVEQRPDVNTPVPSVSKEERWSAVSEVFDSTVKRAIPVKMRSKKGNRETEVQKRMSQMSMDTSDIGNAVGITTVKERAAKKKRQNRQPRHLVAGTATNAATQDGNHTGVSVLGSQGVANHVGMVAHGDNRDVSTRRNEQARDQMWEIRRVNEQARGAAELIGKATAYSTDAREQKRQAAGQAMATDVGMHNHEAIGAPELIGKATAYNTDSAQMSREQKAQRNAWQAKKVNPQITGNVSRTKEADASWNMKAPLKAGEKHEVTAPALELTFDGRQSTPPEELLAKIAATHMPSGPEDKKTGFFFDMVDKDDCVKLLKMSQTQGGFLFLPDPGFTNIKFTMLFYNKGKVTTHALFRTAPGRPFTLCCVPFAMTNVLLDGAPGTDLCMTLEDVARSLSQSREYWPLPLISGVDAPRSDAETDEMMAIIKEWEVSELQLRNKRALKSRKAAAARLAASAQESAPSTFTVAPRLAKKMSRPTSVSEEVGGSGDGDGAGVSADAAGSALASSGEAGESAPPPAIIKTSPVGTASAQAFYHGKLTKKKAERALLEGQARPKDGTFLIRAHGDEGAAAAAGVPQSYIFTVAATISGKTKPIHHMVEWNAEKMAYILNTAIEFAVSTLDDLVAQLRVRRAKWSTPLTEGINAPKKEEAKKSRKQKKAEAEAAAAAADAAGETVSTTTTDSGVESDPASLGKNIKHLIEVVTSDIRNAGMTSPAYIAMVGEDGAVGPKVKLDRKKRHHSKPFQRGVTNEFTVQLPDVGSLEGVVLSHDAKGEQTWHVASVSVVQHHDEGTWTERHTFKCDTWIDDSNGRKATFMAGNEENQDQAHDEDSDEEFDNDGQGVQFRKARTSVATARNKRNKKLVAEVRIKNANAPGAPELVGRPTNYDTTAAEMIRLGEAQETTEKYRRVNEQVRGELAGGKTVYDHTSAEMGREMALAKTTWAVRAVNPQELIPGLMSRDKEADVVHGAKEFANTDAELEAAYAAGQEMRGTAEFQ